VKFDKVVDIVNRTMASLDLNPLLTILVNGVQIANQVLSTTEQVLSSVVVGNYLQNGDIIKQYSYPPPGSSQTGNTYVNIVFDTQEECCINTCGH
jgi:hypothetical protein